MAGQPIPTIRAKKVVVPLQRGQAPHFRPHRQIGGIDCSLSGEMPFGLTQKNVPVSPAPATAKVLPSSNHERTSVPVSCPESNRGRVSWLVRRPSCSRGAASDLARDGTLVDKEWSDPDRLEKRASRYQCRRCHAAAGCLKHSFLRAWWQI